MIQLVAMIDGSREFQGEYSNMAAVFSRIAQLNSKYEFLGVNRPTEYEIIILGGEK